MRRFLFISCTLSILFASYESDCFDGKEINVEINEKVKSKYYCIEILFKSKETTTIFIVKSIEDERVYVMKMVQTSEKSTREVKIMEKLTKANCPYVAKLYYHFNDGKYDFIVQDYGSKGTLMDVANDLITSRKKIDLKIFYTYAEQITTGLICIHQALIYHVDIKLENVAIGDKGPLIFDFDLSLDTSENVSFLKPRGTPDYFSPLYFNKAPFEYNASDDLFSLTITLYTLYYQNSPFNDDPDANYFSNLKIGKYKLASKTENTFVNMMNYGLSYYKRRDDFLNKKDIMNEFLALAKEGVIKEPNQYSFTSKSEKYDINTKILI